MCKLSFGSENDAKSSNSSHYAVFGSKHFQTQAWDIYQYSKLESRLK